MKVAISRRPDFADARAVIVELALAFGGRSPSEREAEWEAFDRFIVDLTMKGWTRGDIYHLLADVLDNERSRLPEESWDSLYDYHTSLIGHCARSCIPSFPGEPTEEESFLEYVYGMAWLNK
jgi:hypothetical protein